MTKAFIKPDAKKTDEKKPETLKTEVKRKSLDERMESRYGKQKASG